MRRMVVLPGLIALLGLLGCGKSGDRGLEWVVRSNHVEIRDPAVAYDLDRHAGKGFAVRPTAPDIEIIDASWVAEDVVDRFLRAVAEGRVPAKKPGGKVQVLVWPRQTSADPGEPFRLDLAGDEEPLAALLTSIGRPALP